MSIRVYSNTGVLLDLWDDTVRTYTDFRPTPSVSRAYNATENARADAEAAASTAGTNSADLITKARNALSNNVAYLAIASPTTAQAVAQVAKLTRQNDALIKLAVGDLQTVDGT